MDRKIDLTLNRDFREKNSSIDRPRSIFRREYDRLRSIYNHININSTIGTGTNITLFNSWNTTNNFTTNSIVNFNENYCDCCGKDITRLPWSKESYGSLCKRCFERLERTHGSRIPWK